MARAKSSPKLKDGKKAASDRPILAAKIVEVRDTYGKMSAKSRGGRIHTGPLQLRKALPPRDTTEWVRSAKQPYSTFESLGNEATVKPPKSKGPPPLWLPLSRQKFLQEKKNEEKAQEGKPSPKAESYGGAEKPAQLSLGEYDDRTLGRRPWDEGHHIMVSRMNGEVQSGVREYFDKPKRKEGEGAAPVRERYVMNDRQLGWCDEPQKPGQLRRTLFDHVGAYSIGGCKDYQLLSWWRKVKDWSSYSTPEMPTLGLRCKIQPHGHIAAGQEKRTLFQALANMPPSEAAAFWRVWVEREKTFGKETSAASPKRSRWNDSWQASWAQGNDEMNWRCREYFSVPPGGTGRSMHGSRASLTKHPMAITLKEALEKFHLDEPDAAP